jgi:hypothetical protein
VDDTDAVQIVTALGRALGDVRSAAMVGDLIFGSAAVDAKISCAAEASRSAPVGAKSCCCG